MGEEIIIKIIIKVLQEFYALLNTVAHLWRMMIIYDLKKKRFQNNFLK